MHERLTLALVTVVAAALPAAGGEEELLRQGGQWVRQASPAEGTPAGELAIIRRDLDHKRYGRAAKRAKRFLKRYPADPLREEACCLAGDAELRRGNHWQAHKWYRKHLQEFPKGDLVDRALEREIEVARAFFAGRKRKVGKVLRLSAEKEGIEILEQVAQLAIGTPRAEIALLTIADHCFGKEDWSDAAGRYDSFLKLFPKSPRAAHAEYRAAESFRRAYRGPFHDDTALIEAEQRYAAFARRHPARAAEVKVDQALQQVRRNRAAKQYEVGQFYLRTDKPEAAAYYFKLVVRDYAGTDWHGRATAALAKIAKASAGKQEPPAEGKGEPSDKEGQS